MPVQPRRITRRRMLAASGATLSATALAACGNEREAPSDERDAELLNSVLASQLALSRALRFARSGAPQELAPALAHLQTRTQRAERELRVRIEEAGGTPGEDPAPDESNAESAVEGTRDALSAALATSIEVAGRLSEDERRLIYEIAFDDAAALAAVRRTLGEDPAPEAFAGATQATGGS